MGVVGGRDGVMSRTCKRWLMILEVTVLGLKEEVVRPTLKMAVRGRSPWPEEKLQKRATQLLRRSVACMRFLCCCRNLG